MKIDWFGFTRTMGDWDLIAVRWEDGKAKLMVGMEGEELQSAQLAVLGQDRAPTGEYSDFPLISPGEMCTQAYRSEEEREWQKSL